MNTKRDLQLLETRERIIKSLDSILENEGLEAITFKKVASVTGLTEMTVYRHFPTREKLLQALWKKIAKDIGPTIDLPKTRREAVEQLPLLFQGYDEMSEKIQTTFYTPEGRDFRLSVNDARKKSFKGIINESSPQLLPKEKKKAAAIVQLLHSSFAWVSLKEQWNLEGKEAAEACQWAISVLLKELEGKKKLELKK